MPNRFSALEILYRKDRPHERKTVCEEHNVLAFGIPGKCRIPAREAGAEWIETVTEGQGGGGVKILYYQKGKGGRGKTEEKLSKFMYVHSVTVDCYYLGPPKPFPLFNNAVNNNFRNHDLSDGSTPPKLLFIAGTRAVGRFRWRDFGRPLRTVSRNGRVCTNSSS